MSLTRDDWVKVVVGFGAVILTVMLNIGVREWYQSDIRYEVGSWYRTTNLDVAILRLQNVGRSDAENVTVTASFIEPLIDIAVGEPMALHFDISAGGIGQKAVTGSIKRLVPNEKVDIYFATNPAPLGSELGQFIRSIKFNGGQGKTGEPFLPIVLIVVISLVVWIVLAFLTMHFTRRGQRRQLATFYDALGEAVQLGLSAAQKKLSEEQFRVMFEEQYGKVTFRKGSLMMAAHAAFVGAKQHLTPTEG
jgi:hypothetical protein